MDFLLIFQLDNKHAAPRSRKCGRTELPGPGKKYRLRNRASVRLAPRQAQTSLQRR
jgi:hypothetical protein